jgi:hypothetical protein
MAKVSRSDAADATDQALIASLAKLWPHREHESNAVKNLFCHIGIDRWLSLDSKELYPEREVRYCSWCPRIKIDGVVYYP